MDGDPGGLASVSEATRDAKDAWIDEAEGNQLLASSIEGFVKGVLTESGDG